MIKESHGCATVVVDGLGVVLVVDGLGELVVLDGLGAGVEVGVEFVGAARPERSSVRRRAPEAAHLR